MKAFDKPFTAVALVVLALVAVLHAFRLLFGWSVIVDGVAVPMWASWLGLVIAAGLAIGLWQETQDGLVKRES